MQKNLSFCLSAKLESIHGKTYSATDIFGKEFSYSTYSQHKNLDELKASVKWDDANFFVRSVEIGGQGGIASQRTFSTPIKIMGKY